MATHLNRVVRVVARRILSVMPLISFPRANAFLFRQMGYKVDDSARVYSTVEIMGAIDVAIGARTFVGHETIITGGLGKIQIGRDCDISDRVEIFCGTHEIDARGIRSAGIGAGRDILVEDGVWIGFGAKILPGVKIGRKAVVAAGAVVHKDVPERMIVGGNPLRVIRSIDTPSNRKQ